jgi:flagellar basal body rod protein FlgB
VALEVFDPTFDRVQAAMSLATQRQAVIAHNIANANVPGYQALEFDAVLKKAVARQNAPTVVLAEEMGKLSQNALDYSTCVKLMSSKLNVLKTVASQGRR